MSQPTPKPHVLLAPIASLIRDIDRGGVRPLILWRVGDRTIDVYDQMLIQRLGRSGWHRAVTAGGGLRKIFTACLRKQASVHSYRDLYATALEKEAPDGTSGTF